MSHRNMIEDEPREPLLGRDDIAAPLQPAAAGLDPLRFRTLRKPLDAPLEPNAPLAPGVRR
jgi:hypothetical protein